MSDDVHEFEARRGKSSGVLSAINYLGPVAERPYNFMFDPPAGTPRQNCTFEAFRTWISDARTRPVSPILDVEGFELWDAPTTISDFADTAAVRGTYYAEAVELAKHVTGGGSVHIFDHAVRTREPGRPPLTFGRSGDGSRPGAAGRVHNDYTEVSGLRRFDLVPVAESTRLGARYFCIVNIWRSIGGKVEDTPLALCDARTVTAKELVPADILYPDRKGEIYLVRQSDHHNWSYFSQMDRHEALIFKQYDSRVSGVSRFTPHAAFDLPDIPPHAPLRRSIEVRCLVVYD